LPRPAFEALSAIKHHLCPEKVPDSNYYVSYFYGKKGIEVGGPSPLFKNALPLYKKIKSLDGVNFSNSTLWEGKIEEGPTFNFYKNKMGFQFISDSTDLSQISDAYYDFVLSSNCLEHIANPLKALSEWKRILKDDGLLLLILPNKKSNFDHYRPTTSFEHILEDYKKNTSEYDLTHLEEILTLHDLSMDLPAGNIQNFKKRSLDNYTNRSLHHHVFDINVMIQMVEFIGFKTLRKNETFKNFFLLATKTPKAV
jgi:ubiquinone/menaquinone biosynthesis C-methylase UbiE